jgi:SAM-dependent methyltransferase
LITGRHAMKSDAVQGDPDAVRIPKVHSQPTQAGKPSPTAEHLEDLKNFYDRAGLHSSWGSQCYCACLARCYNQLIPPGASVLEIGCGSGELLSQLNTRKIAGVDVSPKQVELARQRLPQGRFFVQAGENLSLSETFDFVILTDTINEAADIEEMLKRVKSVSSPQTRVILNFYSNLWKPILSLTRWLGWADPMPESSWLTPSDVRNLLGLAGFEIVKMDARILCPLPMLGLDHVLNRFVAPFFQWFCLANFCVARRKPAIGSANPSVSVVIPARNEAGNIEAVVCRAPDMGGFTELIFVEGGSSDNTWEEIQRMQAKHPSRRIKLLRQTGKGKGNAVREGFDLAEGDILMILDADLTMPPEDLPKFYEVLVSGHAEFANGSRLVYPMENQAMQFFNLCANKMFGAIFSWLMGQPIKDTLCGTKTLTRANYAQIAANRHYFGEFDPFGDFDLLFGAGRLNLKIADVPIRYRNRTYGSTNIQRWRHGWLLLRMIIVAARKLKFAQGG